MAREGRARGARVVLLVLLVMGCAPAARAPGLPPSPCPAVYSYEVDASGRTVGLISLLTPPRYAEVRLQARLSSPVAVTQQDAGGLLVKGGDEGAMQATRGVLAGRRHVLQFQLTFPASKPIPTLLALTVNDHVICQSRVSEEELLSTITLSASLSTGVRGAPHVPGHEFSAGDGGGGGGGGGEGFGGDFETFDPEAPRPKPRPKPRPAPRPALRPAPRPVPRPMSRPMSRPTPRPTRPPPKLPSEDPELWSEPTTSRPRPKPSPKPGTSGGNQLLDPNNCGVATVPNPLVVNGFEAQRGQWPWQAALYVKNETESYNIIFSFVCGGSLVSRKHIVTAAHCLMTQEKLEVQVISVNDMYVRLGKHNIKRPESEEQHYQVQKFAVHPAFNRSSLQNDIAVIHLSSFVEINTYVTPVCLWDREDELTHIVGKIGTVGGWGKYEKGPLSDTLRITRMPIVSEGHCLRSNAFFLKFTSEKTFCAGYRNGSSVCNGDSGGGLQISLENPTQNGPTWYLRGVVSLSMVKTDDGGCDPDNYIVFTDVAKYMTWLNQQFI